MAGKLKLRSHYVARNGNLCMNEFNLKYVENDEIQIFINHGAGHSSYRLDRSQKQKLIEFLLEG